MMESVKKPVNKPSAKGKMPSVAIRLVLISASAVRFLSSHAR